MTADASVASVLASHEVLRHIRPTILVTDRVGIILQAHGGSGRPLGYLPEELEGQHGLAFVAPEDHQLIGGTYVGSDELPVVAAPEPFPVRILAADGTTRTWDCVPGGFNTGDHEGWILTLTCRAEQNASIEARDCFIAGGSSRDIATVVAERYDGASDNTWRKTALVVYRDVHLDGTADDWVVLKTGSADSRQLATILNECLHDRSAPWNRLSPGAMESDSRLPERMQTAALAAGLPYCTTLAIGIEGTTQIVFLRLSNFSSELNVNNRLADQAVDSTLRRALLAERSRAVLDETMRSDPLTGIANRRRFDEVLATAAPSAPQAALYVDIDNFKLVNDTYGHAAGDETLKVVASRIVGACRPNDIVARIGGDEFAVILGDVTAQEARRVAGRIESSMQHAVNLPGGPRLISVTIGIAASSIETNLGDLVRAADQAMLAQKPGTQKNDQPVDLRRKADVGPTSAATVVPS